jgi:hypothetical protein
MPAKPVLRKKVLPPMGKKTEVYTVLVASLAALKVDAEDSDSACKRAMDLSHITEDQISNRQATLDDRVIVSRVANVSPKDLAAKRMSELSHGEFDQLTCERLVDLIAAPKDSPVFIVYDQLEKSLLGLMSHLRTIHTFGCDTDLHDAGDHGALDRLREPPNGSPQ